MPVGLKVVRQGLTIKMKDLDRIWTSVLGQVGEGTDGEDVVVIQGCPRVGEIDVGLQGPHL